MQRTNTILLFMLCVPVLKVNADTIYKSVDESGNITYSQTPPADSDNASEIKLQPPPTDERIEDAQQRHERNLEAAQILEHNRKKREEIIAEENRLRKENQRTSQQQGRSDKASDDDRRVYPYYYPYPRPRPPVRPGPRPPVNLPVR
jgi:hypothetical protein